MKGNFVVRTLFIVIGLLMTITNVIAQETQPEPLVYEGIEFPELPYVSRWIEVNGSKMHYLEGGDSCWNTDFILAW